MALLKPVHKKTPTVLHRFYRREHRDLVIRQRRQLKGTGLTVIEDLTSLNVETFNRARNSPLVDKSWAWNGKVYGLLKSGEKVMIKPFQAIQDCHKVKLYYSTKRQKSCTYFLLTVNIVQPWLMRTLIATRLWV